MSAALRHRTVRLVAALYAGSVLLEWAVAIALMVAVYVATNSAAAAAAMLVCTQLVPNIAIAAFADRLDALGVRTVLVASTLTQAAGVIVAGALGHGVQFYVAAVAIGAGSSIARAQLRTALARAGGEGDDLVRGGNALLGVVRGPSSLLGPALGGAAVGIVGPSLGLVAFGVAYVLLAVGALRLPTLRPATRATDVDAAMASVSSVRQVPVRLLLVIAAAVALTFSVDEPVLISYADRALGAGTSGYSALFVAWGAGVLAGSVVFSRLLARPMLSLFALGLGLNVLGHVGLVLAPSLGFALAAAALGGFGNGIDWSALTTAVQEAAPEGEEASVAGRFEAICTIGIGVGVAIGGLVADGLGPRATLAIPAVGGALVIAALGIAWLRSRRVSFRPVPSYLPSIQGGAS